MPKTPTLFAVLTFLILSGETRPVRCVGDACLITMNVLAVKHTTWFNEDQIEAIAEAEQDAINGCRNDVQCSDGCEELMQSGAFPSCGGCAETVNPTSCSIDSSGIIEDDGHYTAFARASGHCGCNCGDGGPPMMMTTDPNQSTKPKPGRGAGAGS